MTHPHPTSPVILTQGTVVFGRYALEEILGEGGMGTVWAARHTVTRKPVALKFLKRKGSEHVHRFLREARIVSALKHPNVVQVYDVLQFDDDSPVMVMDRLFGESLGARLKRDRTIPLPEVAFIAMQVADVVGAAHGQGVVHRDLKPENIFLSRASDPGKPYDTVKVLDFGIAKLTALDGDAAQTAVLTVTGDLMGTPYYMAPEQVFGERAMDHRADIWSLGVILYECLAGRRPFEGENVGQVLKGITLGQITPLESVRPDLPEPLTALVGRMLSRDPDARPKSLTDVATVFGPLADGVVAEGVPARGGALARRGAAGRRSVRARWALVAVMVASIAGGVGFWRYRAGRSEPAMSEPSALSEPSARAGSSEVAAPGAPVIRPVDTTASAAPNETPAAAASTPPASKAAAAHGVGSPGAASGAHPSTAKRVTVASAAATAPAAAAPSQPSSLPSSRAPRLPGGVYGESPYP